MELLWVCFCFFPAPFWIAVNVAKIIIIFQKYLLICKLLCHLQLERKTGISKQRKKCMNFMSSRDAKYSSCNKCITQWNYEYLQFKTTVAVVFRIPTFVSNPLWLQTLRRANTSIWLTRLKFLVLKSAKDSPLLSVLGIHVSCTLTRQMLLLVKFK